MKALYDRRSNADRRDKNDEKSFPLKDSKGEHVAKERRSFGDRRKTEGLEISTADICEHEFDEVFKQFKQDEIEEVAEKKAVSESLEIINYQVLYRKNVECAYITILHINEQHDSEPTLYAFRDQEINGDSASESKPTHVQNIYGADAYQSYVDQGWEDISKSENNFPWPIKTWLAQNMKQDTITSRR